MEFFRWVLVAALSLLAGFLVVKYLTAKPATMTWFAMLALLSAAGLLSVTLVWFTCWYILLAVLVALAGFCAGWLVANHIFLRQEEHRRLPELNSPPPEKRDHTAVIYFTHGEPPGYDPMPWVETFKEFDAARAPFIPVPFRPLFFRQFRGAISTLAAARTIFCTEKCSPAWSASSVPKATVRRAFTSPSSIPTPALIKP